MAQIIAVVLCIALVASIVMAPIGLLPPLRSEVGNQFATLTDTGKSPVKKHRKQFDSKSVRKKELRARQAFYDADREIGTLNR